jgi:DNA polymerase III subunit beta
VVAASRDDTLPALGAVQVSFAAEAVTLVVTDRYRVVLRRLPRHPTGSELPARVLVPAPALSEAARATDGDPLRVHLLTGPDGIPAVAGFAVGGQALTIRLTGGEYPNVAGLIPPSTPPPPSSTPAGWPRPLSGWRSWPPATPRSGRPSSPARSS